MDRRDLAGKLSRATDWVREEFAAIEEIAAGLGCEPRLEGGPGLAFRLSDRVIAKAHPKQRHVGIGLPNRMRPDVEALTGELRGQKDHAWFAYAPATVDRDTIELLFGLSVETSVPDGSRRQHPGARPGASPLSRPPLDDEADLRLVLAVLRAFQEHATTTGAASATKPLRETLYFRWEGPRLPPGGKYSPLLPHSPSARERRRVIGRPTGLVYEHVIPIAGVIHGLLRDPPPDEEALREVLEATADRVIITKAEDDLITAAGFRAEVPEPDDPWSKYRAALGLQRFDFTAFAGPDDEPAAASPIDRP